MTNRLTLKILRKEEAINRFDQASEKWASLWNKYGLDPKASSTLHAFFTMLTEEEILAIAENNLFHKEVKA